MPDSDHDKSTANDAAAPEPKGGDSDSPTRAFAIPTATAEGAESDAAQAADEATDDATAPLVEESVDLGGTDAAETDEAVAEADDAADTAEVEADDLATNKVAAGVAGAAGAAAVAGKDDDANTDAEDVTSDASDAESDDDVAEASEDTSTATDDEAADDGTPDETAEVEEAEVEAPKDSADQADKEESASIDSTEGEVESGADITPTEKLAKPAAAAAGAAVTADAATTVIRKPKAPAAPSAPAAPKVIPAEKAKAAQEPKKGRGKLIGILLAVVIVLVAVVVGLWYLLVGAKPEAKAADAAKSFQEALKDGDLAKLREVTCGAENQYYSNVSAEDFQRGYNTQKARNQLMQFDDVDAVSVDGDTARVGVDTYPASDPSKKTRAQITLQKVDGDWKVCKSLN